MKIDAGCTTDATRILRVPGTMNYKTGTGLPVKLLSPPKPYIPLDTMRQSLDPYMGKGATTAQAKGTPATLDQFTAELLGGIEQPKAALRNIDQVSAVCAFVWDTLDTAGRDWSNPLWFLSLAVASFCEDPEATAHRLSSGHPGYHKDETDQEITRCLNNRQVKTNVGFPSCKAIEAAGAPRAKFARCLPSASASARRSSCKPKTKKVVIPIFPGGVYAPDAALELVGTRFTLVDHDGELNIIHRTKEGRDVTMKKENFHDYLKPVSVLCDDGGKPKEVPASHWWFGHKRRPPVRTPVFKPHGEAAEDEYNFWRGFGVAPLVGMGKIRKLLRHIKQLICKNDKNKFRYLIKWLAWLVQHPDRHAEVVVSHHGRR